jgi:hypothetical protein
VLGFYPRPILDAITPAVKATLQHTGNTDPAAVVPPSALGADSGGSP